MKGTSFVSSSKKKKNTHTHKCKKCLNPFLEMKLYVTGMSFNGLTDSERNMFEMYTGNSQFSFCK